MKRKILSFFLLTMMFFSLGSVTWANDTGIVPFASDYLEGYSVYLRSSKTGRMAVDITVEATDIADIIGIHSIYIEHQVNGRWKFYDTLDSIDYPEFYMYDSPDYTATIYFDGVSGDTYRVTITPYAKIGNGSDTGSLTSSVVKCK